MGRVVQLVPSSDGKVRCVKVLKPDRSESTHSIKHLIPLELNVYDDHQEDCVSNDSGNVADDGVPPRPLRKAAVECLKRLRCD